MSKKKQDLEAKIIKKALEDAAFKKELINNPKAAIEKALEIAIPEGIEIKVVEETAKTVYLVLPAVAINTEKTENSGKLEAQTFYY